MDASYYGQFFIYFSQSVASGSELESPLTDSYDVDAPTRCTTATATNKNYTTNTTAQTSSAASGEGDSELQKYHLAVEITQPPAGEIL
mgnify:CR=1 FL=1